MDFKSCNISQSRRESSCKNVLESLMKEMKMNSNIKNELLHFAGCGKTFPYVPKELIKPLEDEKPIIKILSKLPPKPLQRMKSTIIESGSYQVERYRPNPSQTRSSKEKERLQNLMAFGKEFDVVARKLPQVEERESTHFCSDLFDEILKEIKERRDFLKDMKDLGLEKKYLPEIQCQISLRLKELEKLDKDRAEDFLDYGIG